MKLGIDRNEIADEIEIISNYFPKLIGIDAFFEEKRDELSDLKLMAIMHQKKNIVLASRNKNDDTGFTNIPNIFHNPSINKSGYADFVGRNANVVVRNFILFIQSIINGTNLLQLP